MGERVLITGGAGFIGSHLADQLIGRGDRVRVLDSLIGQVHGAEGRRPSYLHSNVELIVGDVRDPAQVRRALAGTDAVVHLAARVGVGQSMYQSADYVGVNDVGTAVLLETLSAHPVRRLVAASSMSVYGEGLYVDAHGRAYQEVERSVDQLREGDWEVRGDDGTPLLPMPTPESKTPGLPSVYALTKYDQERLCLMLGQAYGVPTIALRFFNVYGTRQSLSNPYTGVLAIFASRLLNDRGPLIFEDGHQRRDFVHVSDVARACLLALDAAEPVQGVFNIGSGDPVSVLEIAEHLARVVDRTDLEPEVTGTHRVGDIRNCFADITKARVGLGYEPRVTLDEGLTELASWLAGEAALDRATEARAELVSRGLSF